MRGPVGWLVFGVFNILFFLMMIWQGNHVEEERIELLLCQQRYHSILIDGKCFRP